MIKYPEDYNPIFEYNDKIQSGEIVACTKVKKVYRHIVDNINNPDFEFEYSSKKANKAIEFIENFCKHSKGKWGGKLIDLELWQKAIIAAAFGMVNKKTQIRQFREVFLMVARKNGKTVLLSGLALYCLTADAEQGAEVYSVATKQQQAKIIWSESRSMIKKMPALNRRIKCLVSELRYGDSVFRPLSSDSKSMVGLNISGLFVDELHEIRDPNLYNVCVDGTAAREQPVIFIISTAGTHREGIFDKKYEQAEKYLANICEGKEVESTFLPIIYELDKREEWLDESAWIKANPNLDISKSVDNIKVEVEKAKSQPFFLNNLLCKHFNIRSSSSAAWLNFDQIDNTETFDISDFKSTYFIGGVDISSSTDLTAACMLFGRVNSDILYIKHMYWLPEDLLEKRSKEDDVPYDKWYERGLMRVCRGNKVNPSDITAWYKEFHEEYEIIPYKIGYDIWGAGMWAEEMKCQFGKNTLIPVRQGAQTLSSPMKQLGADFESKLINYNNNPATKWCISNTACIVDSNNNIKPNKSNQRRRIDGLACLLNAYTVYLDEKNDYKAFIEG